LVERLRVLGIRAGDAGGVADAAVNLTDMTIDSSLTLSALVADPVSGRTYSATWGVCLTAISDTASSIDCPGPNSLPLPSGPCVIQLPCTTQLMQSDFMSWLTSPQQGLDPATIDPTLTQVDIWIGFLVSAQDASGVQVDEVRAVKRLPVHLYRTGSKPDASTFNQNPVLTGLTGMGVGPNTIDIKPGGKIKLKPNTEDSSRDSFTPSGETATRQEDFVYTWFSTIGEFDYARTISAWDNQDKKLDENVWAIPETLTDDQKADTTLWLVMRDGRFGVDWKVFTGRFK
jgi:hypothetical protein